MIKKKIHFIAALAHRYKFLSFAAIGAFMTLLSQGTILLFTDYLFRFPLKPTYVVVQIVTILISFFLNSYLTFKTEITLRNTFRYYTIYLSSTALGWALLGIFQKTFVAPNWVYLALALPFTLSFNFIVSSKKLTPKAQ